MNVLTVSSPGLKVLFERVGKPEVINRPGFFRFGGAGAVIACNHVGWADSLWMAYAVYPRQLRYISKEELFGSTLYVVLSLPSFRLVLSRSLSRGAWVPKNLARRRKPSAAPCLLDLLGPPGRRSGCWPHDGEVAGGAVADFVLVISGSRRRPRRSQVRGQLRHDPIATAG